MKVQIKIEHNQNGVKTVETLPADLIKWERATKSKMTDLFSVENGEPKLHLGFEDLGVMAWAVLTRTGETTAIFNEWVNELQSIELLGVDENVNPTHAEV